MCSQRCHITNVGIYGKNAERFLSLRPSYTKKNNHTHRYKFEMNEIEDKLNVNIFQ